MPITNISSTTRPTTILLIRHGETAWNAERRLQGHIDIALNAEGERQAGALAAVLAAERIDAVVASDLQRAWQTAEAIAGHHGLPVPREPGLRERCFGGFEGLLYAEIEQRFPAEFAAWQARRVDAAMPDGLREAETFRQFYHRAVGAIVALGARHPGRTLALVAHGGVLECAYRAALGLSLETPRDFAVINASINRFTLADGKLSLASWGEVGHLRDDVLDELN
ncbi:histidine phosphatase family protein [Massilia glaciei]|uniref:Histidine phosphatase family protein n=1 Tax=Massilia glaciei TaxID=1524097 RepID=A0A2U2HP71_9BURK|nr:histidine phosphatase family protein [Massilia glaciei]PWF49215.1 histidine phosphatase family protein [Massilia glaciei]